MGPYSNRIGVLARMGKRHTGVRATTEAGTAVVQVRAKSARAGSPRRKLGTSEESFHHPGVTMALLIPECGLLEL